MVAAVEFVRRTAAAATTAVAAAAADALPPFFRRRRLSVDSPVAVFLDSTFVARFHQLPCQCVPVVVNGGHAEALPAVVRS